MSVCLNSYGYSYIIEQLSLALDLGHLLDAIERDGADPKILFENFMMKHVPNRYF